MEERLQVNDNMKAAMILAVVLYHFCMFFVGDGFDKVAPVFSVNYLSVFARYMNSFHVQTFAIELDF